MVVLSALVLLAGVLAVALHRSGQFGNTPGHVNHWARGGFRSFVATRFDVDAVRSPLPWTMVRARSR